MTIILKGVNPTTFNLVASIIAEILQLAGAYTLCSLLHLMVSIYLRRGKKIPANALGPLPAGLIDAFHYAQTMKWAWPATLALCLFMSDYATVIAFAGLGFVEVDQEGPQAPVLNLAQRNHFVPYGAFGDPLLPFTASKLELLVESSTLSAMPTISQQKKIRQLVREEAIVASFLGAADSIAQGNSVFLQQSRELQSDPTLLVLGQMDRVVSFFSDVDDSVIVHGQNSSLIGINLEIPLDCSDDVLNAIEKQRDENEWMKSIQEVHGHDDWTVESRVANCTFTSARSSGAYGQDGQKAEITGYASVASGGGAKLLVESQGFVDDHSTFVFPYEGLYLARQAKDFRQGRQVFGFAGVQVGNVTIPFESTVVASGKSFADPPKALDPQDQNAVRTREYVLISKVQDEKLKCPRDPSGAIDSVCILTTKITCETFGSEVGSGGLLEEQGPSSNSAEFPDKLEHNCVFDGEIEIIWGKGYNVDQHLLAAVAGIHGRNSGWASSLVQQRTLSVHSIPAALFMLGTLGSRSSVEQVRSTTIDGIFIAFMCVPVCLCVLAGLVYLIGTKYLLPLPDNGGSLVKLTAKLLQKQANTKTEPPANEESLWLGRSLFFVPQTSIPIAKSAQCEKTDKTTSASDNRSSIEFKRHTKPNTANTALRTKDKSEVFEWNGEFLALAVNSNDKLAQIESDEISVEEEIIFIDAKDGNTVVTDHKGSNQTKTTLKLGSGFFGVDLSMEKELDVPVITGEGQVHAASCHMTHSTGTTDEEQPPVPSNETIQQTEVRASQQEQVTTETPKSSSCRKFLHGTGIYVAACMVFCAAVTFLSTFFIVTKGVASHSKQNTYMYTPLYNKQQDPGGLNLTVPPGCFHNNQELRRAILEYAYSDHEAQKDILSEYGAIQHWCVDYVDDFSFVFASIPEVPNLDVSRWNVSGVKSFAFCFYNYDFSYGNLDVSQWDVSSSTNFRGMFYATQQFNGDLSQWDVSSGRDFAGLFLMSPSFNSDISNWNVSSASDFSWMFHQASAFNSDLSKWDVSSGTDFGWMLSEAPSFVSDLSQWDVSSGSSFRSMFRMASRFDSDLSSWDVSSGTSFKSMFQDGTGFKSDLSRWNVSRGTSFESMFRGATAFNSDLSMWDVSSGTDFGYMFSETPSFDSDLSTWDVSAGANFNGMFEIATKFNANLSQWDVSQGRIFSGMFSEALSFNSDLSAWNVSSGTNFYYMFGLSRRFNADLSQWDVSSGTDFRFMFFEATSFNSNLCSWQDQIGVVGDTTSMFLQSGCPHVFVGAESMCQICSPTPSPSSQIPTSSPPPTMSNVPTTTTATPTESCMDQNEWTDYFGDGCTYYAAWGCDGADTWANLFGVSAIEACCTCGGGSFGVTPVGAPVQSPVVN